MHWRTASLILFALTFVAVGVIGVVTGDFAPIWAGVPKTLPEREAVAYLCAVVALLCGAGLHVRRTAAPAALVLLVYLIVWTALFKVPFILRQPLVEVSYQTCGENAVMIAAAWVLYVEFAKRRTFPAGAGGLRAAHVLYGLALIAFGFSHFAYLNLTAPLVPGWLPAPVFWAYLTGAIYLATGVALVTGFFSRIGALLAAVQITLITLLVWGPGVAAGRFGPSNWQEPIVSWVLMASAWVLAISFERAPWLRPAPFGAFGRSGFARG